MCDKNLEEQKIVVNGVEVENRHGFVYKKDCVDLKFNLRVDITDQLECFIPLLEMALVDVKNKLAEIKSKENE